MIEYCRETNRNCFFLMIKFLLSISNSNENGSNSSIFRKWHFGRVSDPTHRPGRWSHVVDINRTQNLNPKKKSVNNRKELNSIWWQEWYNRKNINYWLRFSFPPMSSIDRQQMVSIGDESEIVVDVVHFGPAYQFICARIIS